MNGHLEVECGVHNHPTTQHVIGRLSQAEEKFVIDMSNNNSQPKDISIMLHRMFPDNKSTIKTIYNARLKHKTVGKAGKSRMQYLIGRLKEHEYFYRHRRCEKTGVIEGVFFAHPTSVGVLGAFLRVLLRDRICKTNNCKLPLLDMVGVTSTSLTFQAAFEDYKWESLNAGWDILVYADTGSTFYEMLGRFQGDYVEYSGAIEYVTNQWIQPYKE
ncbi:hypothetical protein OROHE_019077 [Orobanche hederae]